MPCIVADACDLLAVTPNKSLDLDGFAEKTDEHSGCPQLAHAVRYLWGRLGGCLRCGERKSDVMLVITPRRCLFSGRGCHVEMIVAQPLHVSNRQRWFVNCFAAMCGEGGKMELKFANGEVAHVDKAIMGLVDRERMWSHLLKTETTCRMLPTTCGTTADFLVIEYHGTKGRVVAMGCIWFRIQHATAGTMRNILTASRLTQHPYITTRRPRRDDLDLKR